MLVHLTDDWIQALKSLMIYETLEVEQVTDDLVQVNEVIDLKTLKEEMIMRCQLIP